MLMIELQFEMFSVWWLLLYSSHNDKSAQNYTYEHNVYRTKVW